MFIYLLMAIVVAWVVYSSMKYKRSQWPFTILAAVLSLILFPMVFKEFGWDTAIQGALTPESDVAV